MLYPSQKNNVHIEYQDFVVFYVKNIPSSVIYAEVFDNIFCLFIYLLLRYDCVYIFVQFAPCSTDG